MGATVFPPRQNGNSHVGLEPGLGGPSVISTGISTITDGMLGTRERVPVSWGPRNRNLWGFHDMHGNINEWTDDDWSSDHTAHSRTQEPQVHDGSMRKVVRMVHRERCLSFICSEVGADRFKEGRIGLPPRLGSVLTQRIAQAAYRLHPSASNQHGWASHPRTVGGGP